MARTPIRGTPTSTSLPTGLSLGPIDDARFAPGHLFASRYRIVSLLGRGAMGEVYRADDLRLGQAVALKLMSDAVARRRDGLARLNAEVRLARSIVHPNVCRVYDIGHADGWHYLSMEYVDGETLASLLRRLGQLPISKALEMARQLCAGVGAAHQRGVLHRDLKPSNIMLDGRGQIRIMDFGLAIAVADDVREVAGTPGYMAPEQLTGGAVTERSDLYSLGRVLAEILPAGVDPAALAIAQACMAMDPTQRPASAHEVAAALPPADSLVSAWGGIPSPAMVAAAPTTGSLTTPAAWILLVTAVAASVAVARSERVSVAPSQLPKPPEVLAERARQLLSGSGQAAAPTADAAFWWWADDGDDRVRFTYREGSTLLVPANLFRFVSADDPAHDPARMRMVTLEADGTPSSARPPSRTVWSRRMGESDSSPVYWTVVVLAFVASCIMARRNLRAGEGDRTGARRLSIVIGCGTVVVATLQAHHVPSIADELAWLTGVVGWAGLWAAFSWLAYVSFEPYGRRWWPYAMVSWTRMLAARLLDPLVGRDVLFGACVGAMSTAATVIHAYLADHAAPPILVQTALQALRSSPAFGGFVLAAFLNGLVSSLCIVAVLVFFRLLLRKTWLASSGVIVLAVPVFAHGTAPSDIALAVCLAAVNVAVLLRVGVVAHMAMLVMMAWLTWLPLTLDPNAWYFGRSLVVLSLIGGLAAYGFFTALGGRPAFGMLEPAKRLSS